MTTNDALVSAMMAAERAALEGQRTDHIYGVRDGAPPIAPWPKSACRIVFLDFDGVLNSDRSTQELGTRYRFARSSVAALNRVLQQSGAVLVISSTWREHWTLRENAEFLERDGVVPGRVVGKTPILERERGLEIDAWLRSVPYTVESFVILDDRDDMAMHCERLVQVKPEVGLSESQVKRAVELLNISWIGGM
jgi:hypothetical protein